MVAALLRSGPPGGRVQVLGDVLRLGRDPDNDLVLDDPRVRPRHARLRQVKGEWICSAEGDAPLWVNGRAAALFPLRPGDRVALVGPASDVGGFVFEDALAGAFVPPGTSRIAAWAAVLGAVARGAAPAVRGVELHALGPGTVVREVEEPDGACRLEVGAARPDAAACQAPLAAAALLAGAPHPRVAHVLEVGVRVVPEGLRPWIATRRPAGRTGPDLLDQPPLALGPWLRTLATLARALAWLHRRRVVHAALGCGSVVLEAAGDAWLLPRLASRTWPSGSSGEPLQARTPGFTAPEEQGAGAPGPALDVHDLCALGIALRRGAWDAEAVARVAGLRASRGGALRAEDLGLGLPPELEHLLDAGLARDPAQRPNAADVARRLEGYAVLAG